MTRRIKFHRKRINEIILWVIPFAIVGMLAIVITRAVSPYVSIEPENSATTGGAVAKLDGSASGGHYVEFKAGTTSTTEIPAVIPTDPAILNAWRVSTGSIPGPSPDEGAFRLICMPGQLKYDDPIVYPGQPGASHLHMFFGNTLADGNSTFQSLRTTGDSTCQSGPINRSAYWIPAMLNGNGKVIMADLASVYYKGDAKTINLPRGLRYIAGDAMGTIPDDKIYGSANPGVVGGYIYHPSWRCLDSTGNFRPGSESDGIPNCQPTDQVLGRLEFPFCWDGRLDSPNHRDHVVHPKYNNFGQSLCPSTHPQELPRYTLQVFWSVGGENTDNWYLSSDRSNGVNRPDGSTLHGDWFGAWDQGVLETWTQECIREFRTCSASEYGDGTIGRQPTPWNWVNPNRLVDIPPRP